MMDADDYLRQIILMKAYAEIRRTLPAESEEEITLAFSKLVEQIVIALEGADD